MLKKVLLNLGLVVDNEYLDKYCELIRKNKRTKPKKYKTQRHHIIPKYSKSGINDLVVLKHKDHALAHYYLYKCSAKEYEYSNRASLCRVVNGCWKHFDNGDILKVIDEYSKIKEEHYRNMSEELKGKLTGKDNISSKPVLAYNIKGIFLKRYDSITQASKELNISNSLICQVCLGRKNNAKGYQFKYENDIREIKAICVIREDKEVFQYQNGKLIAHYDSLSQASRITGYSKQSIMLWATKKPMKWNKYQWVVKQKVLE